jgi:hypothetical protein
VYLEDSFARGGGHGGPVCLACQQPILQGQAVARVEFVSDPHGYKGLSGAYHLSCSKPFASLARVINLNPWR